MLTEHEARALISDMDSIEAALRGLEVKMTRLRQLVWEKALSGKTGRYKMDGAPRVDAFEKGRRDVGDAETF